MPEIFNVGIVGYGLSAKVFHIPLVLAVPTLRLSAIVQRHPQPKDDAEKDHPGIKSYRSIEAMLQDEDVHLIVITTIPETHSPLAKLALNAGKHVIVEKPFTPTAAEADELIALAKEKSRLLTVYQNRRWDSDFLTVLHLLKSGRLGRVVDFESHFDRHRPEVPADGVTWKTKVIPGSGAAYDLGTHLIDQVVVALGMPKRITGFIGSQRKGETKGYEDSFVILMHYDEGLTATLKAAVVSPEVGQLRYWIRGERGSYKKFHLDCQEDQLKAGKRPGEPGFAVESEERHGTLTKVEGGNIVSEAFPTVEPLTYIEFYKILATALTGEGPVPVAAESARDVIRLVELARESSLKARTLEV